MAHPLFFSALHQARVQNRSQIIGPLVKLVLLWEGSSEWPCLAVYVLDGLFFKPRRSSFLDCANLSKVKGRVLSRSTLSKLPVYFLAASVRRS